MGGLQNKPTWSAERCHWKPHWPVGHLVLRWQDCSHLDPLSNHSGSSPPSSRWGLVSLVLGSVSVKWLGSGINMMPWSNIVIVCAGKRSCGPMSGSTLYPVLCGNISGPLILLMVFCLTGLLSATDFCRHIAVEVLEQFLTKEHSHWPVLCLLPKGFGYCLIHWPLSLCTSWRSMYHQLPRTVYAGRVLSRSLNLIFEPCRYSGSHHRLQTLDTLGSQCRSLLVCSSWLAHFALYETGPSAQR